MNEPTPPLATTDRSETVTASFSNSRAMLRGSLGFALVSVAGFCVWAFWGRWLGTRFGEPGLYAACAIVFVALAGPVLHPLVRGPRSLFRFYRAFVPAFVLYAIAWCGAWFAWRAGWGEWLGSLAGSAVFSVMTGLALGNLQSWARVSAVVFITHSAGYVLGSEAFDWLRSPAAADELNGLSKAQLARLAMLSWGLLYGLGFGAGIGYAFYFFQRGRAAGRTD